MLYYNHSLTHTYIVFSHHQVCFWTISTIYAFWVEGPELRENIKKSLLEANISDCENDSQGKSMPPWPRDEKSLLYPLYALIYMYKYFMQLLLMLLPGTLQVLVSSKLLNGNYLYVLIHFVQPNIKYLYYIRPNFNKLFAMWSQCLIDVCEESILGMWLKLCE